MCPNCGGEMYSCFLKKENEWYWRSNKMKSKSHKKKQMCDTKCSVKKMSIFEGSHLTFEQTMTYIQEWTHFSEIQKVCHEADIGSFTTAALYNKLCTEVVINACFANSIGKQILIKLFHV